VTFLIADFIVGDVKQEESESIQEAGHKPRDGSQVNYERLPYQS
jgi:hypothetical protein